MNAVPTVADIEATVRADVLLRKNLVLLLESVPVSLHEEIAALYWSIVSNAYIKGMLLAQQQAKQA